MVLPVDSGGSSLADAVACDSVAVESKLLEFCVLTGAEFDE